MTRLFARLVAAALVAVCASAAVADTVVYIGQCGTVSSTVPVVPHAGTGCPSTGSWEAGNLAVGTDGVLCYSTVGGSPGTWVEVGGGGGASALDDLSDVVISSAASGEVLRFNGTSWVDAQLAYSDLSGTPSIPADGSDVGLADSPSTDGPYYLSRSSGTNAWQGLSALATLGELDQGACTGVSAGYVLTCQGDDSPAWEAGGGGGPTVVSLASPSAPMEIPEADTFVTDGTVTIPAAALTLGRVFNVAARFTSSEGSGTPDEYGMGIAIGSIGDGVESRCGHYVNSLFLYNTYAAAARITVLTTGASGKLLLEGPNIANFTTASATTMGVVDHDTSGNLVVGVYGTCILGGGTTCPSLSADAVVVTYD